MNIIGIIQARMGSTRLPGKVMLSLNGEYNLCQIIRRISKSSQIDNTVVTTSIHKQDRIIERYAHRSGAKVYRGSETDVQTRMYDAARQSDADVVVRITGDCPLISPEVIDEVVHQLINSGADYSANILERTFPRGLDVEAFTAESFDRIHEESTEPHHREHVTPYYREREDLFEHVSITSDEVFDEPWMQDRTDLRLTLDEADDYELLRTVYENVPYDEILDIRDAVRYIDENDLSGLNANIKQKSM
jgi:spore coat polysaccharide biosynthesis protein SpsF